ncbi:MAG TPA: hypothetical protein VFE48_04405 [Methylomirabilota bacterium]|nr:hypothetical protein [Methylomirabilota bacterium]
MSRQPDVLVLVLGALVVLLLVVVLVLWLRRGRRADESGEALRAHLQDNLAAWVLEGRRLFTTWEERLEGLAELKSRLGGLAEEADRLRIEVSHVQEMRAQIAQLTNDHARLEEEHARLAEEHRRCEQEHAEYRELLARIATLAHEATARVADS